MQDIYNILFPNENSIKRYIHKCAPIIYIQTRSSEKARHYALKKLYGLIAGIYYEKNNFPCDESLKNYYKTALKFDSDFILWNSDILLLQRGLKYVLNLRFCIVLSIWNYFLDNFSAFDQESWQFSFPFYINHLIHSNGLSTQNTLTLSLNLTNAPQCDYHMNPTHGITLQDIIDLKLSDSNKEERKYLQPLRKELVHRLGKHFSAGDVLNVYDVCYHLDFLNVSQSIPRALKTMKLDNYGVGLFLPNDIVTLIMGYLTLSPISTTGEALLVVNLYDAFIKPTAPTTLSNKEQKINVSAKHLLELISRIDAFNGNKLLPDVAKLLHDRNLRNLSLFIAFLTRIRFFFKKKVPLITLNLSMFGKQPFSTTWIRHDVSKIISSFQHVHLTSDIASRFGDFNAGFPFSLCQELMHNCFHLKELTISGDLANFFLNNNENNSQGLNLCEYIFDKLYNLETLHFEPNSECDNRFEDSDEDEDEDEAYERFIYIDPFFKKLKRLKIMTITHQHPHCYSIADAKHIYVQIKSGQSLEGRTPLTNFTNYVDMAKYKCSCGCAGLLMEYCKLQNVTIRRK